MSAQADETERAVLAKLFSGQKIESSLFTPTFLAQVPLAQIQSLISQVNETMGPLTDISQHGDGYTLSSATHKVSLRLVLSAAGEIGGLLMQPVLEVQPVDKILADLASLEGETAYLVTRNGAVEFSHNADMPLAVGSTFKLGILAVLADMIAAGDAQWDDVLHLQQDQISLPTGTLQGFAVGSPVTVHTLAAMMISISDNTGTDVLLDFVDRDAVAAKLGTDFVIKTRELFLLKSDATLRARYLASDIAGKHALMAEMAPLPLPSISAVSTVHDAGIEYYIPLTKLCELMADVANIDVMAINPGVANKTDWQKIAFKGGAEQGVLNLTTQVSGTDGVPICVAFTWNEASELNASKAQALYTSLLDALVN